MGRDFWARFCSGPCTGTLVRKGTTRYPRRPRFLFSIPLTDARPVPINRIMRLVVLTSAVAALTFFPEVAVLAATFFFAWFVLVAFFGENAFLSPSEALILSRWEDVLREAVRFRPRLPRFKSYFE